MALLRAPRSSRIHTGDGAFLPSYGSICASDDKPSLARNFSSRRATSDAKPRLRSSCKLAGL
eukprot:scaffold1848_cov286-Pinguiococcus_pyrenoidosus.AAC.2